MRARPWALAVIISLPGLSAPDGVSGQDLAPRGDPLSPSCTLSEEQCEFLRNGRRATESYHGTTAAMADGFRPVGADAPAMGRHWINLSRLFDGRIDAAKPEILTYAVVDGRETLVGVGFGYVVGPGTHTALPPNPFDPGSWHVHSGRIDMESHRMDHVGGGLHGTESVSHEQEPGHGVSVLHAWVWVENPAGMLEPNNWSLPYFRLGLSRPADARPEADRAISLASSGAAFFIERAGLFTDAGSGPAPDRAVALRAAEAEVREWWQGRPPGPLVSAEVEWLGDLWRRSGLTAP